MPLIALWKSNPDTVAEFTIEQVVATAGNGDLKDGSHCAQELREFLGQVPTSKIAEYVEHCLSRSFGKSGMVLQDLVNELGRRLDYTVTNGRYQGTTNSIGYDGIWAAPEGHTIITEVKTTDAYRISLDTIAGYRDKLLTAGQIKQPSSILVVVGRDDTGELEAQVRGSRHAWDIRLISAEALLKLVQLKENADGPATGQKIRSLLTPMEYTRLDQMVDVMFTTATDVEAAIVNTIPDEIEAAESETEVVSTKGTWEFTDPSLLQEKRDAIVAAVGQSLGTTLIKKSRALYWDATHEHRIACTISKRYTKRPTTPYWYAYHPQWDDFLRDGTEAWLVLGCMDLPFAFSIPWSVLSEYLEALNTTTIDRGTYWHLHVSEPTLGTFELLLPKMGLVLPLNDFKVEMAFGA